VICATLELDLGLRACLSSRRTQGLCYG